MKKALTAALAAAAMLVPIGVPATAQAAPDGDRAYLAGRYLYMVRDVQFDGSIYTGRFTVMAKSGRHVVGAYGMFYSEARCLTGKVKGFPPHRWLVGTFPGFWYGDEWIPAQSLSAKWVGYGDYQRMKGWSTVTADELYDLSGGGVDGTIIETICA